MPRRITSFQMPPTDCQLHESSLPPSHPFHGSLPESHSSHWRSWSERLSGTHVEDRKMRIPYQRRLVYAGTIFMVIVYVSAIILLALSGGCAISARSISGVPSLHDLRLHASFDNSGDSGSHFLVGPPPISPNMPPGSPRDDLPPLNKLAIRSSGAPTITDSNSGRPDASNPVDATLPGKEPDR